jgi:uncharacterized protein
MDPGVGTYGVLLVSGLLGSLGHCLGMCGPLVSMVGIRVQARGWSGVPRHLLYHGARVAVYVLLGAVVGRIGSLLGMGSGLSRWAGIVSLVLGLLVVLVGLGYLGWMPMGRFEGAGVWLTRAMSRALQLGGGWAVAALGALNGLLPCGLVYGALLIVASTGGMLPGALGMLLFGLGTLPALLVVGVGSGALSARARQAMSRLSGALIGLVGLQLVLRGASALGWVPHLRWGGLMLW